MWYSQGDDDRIVEAFPPNGPMQPSRIGAFGWCNQSLVRRLQHNLHDNLVRNSAPSAIFQLLPVFTRPALYSVGWNRPRVSCSYFLIFSWRAGYGTQLTTSIDGILLWMLGPSSFLPSLASLPPRPNRCLRRPLCTLELLLESQ